MRRNAKSRTRSAPPSCPRAPRSASQFQRKGAHRLHHHARQAPALDVLGLGQADTLELQHVVADE
jgi:hypothetical protein